jgi:hypothetical protein
MRSHGLLRLVLVTAVLVCCGSIGRTSGADHDIGALVANVGERIAAYYHRAQQLICLERSTVVPISSDWSMQGRRFLTASRIKGR